MLSACATLQETFSFLGPASIEGSSPPTDSSGCSENQARQPSLEHLLVAMESGSFESACNKPPAAPPVDSTKARPQFKLNPQPEDPALSALFTGSNTVNPNLTRLAEVVSRALYLSPEIKAATSDIESAKTDIEIARGGYFPALQMGAGPDTGQKGNLGYDIQLSQVLYDWGRVGSRVTAAQATSRQKVEQLVVARSEVALDVVEVYFDIQDAQARLEAAQSYQKKLDKLAALVKDRVSGGYVDSAELSRMQQDQAYAEEQLATEKGNLEAATTSYRILVESEPQKLTVPNTPPVLTLLTNPRSIENVIRRAPHYRQAQEGLAIANANVEKADASLLPELRLEGNHLRREVGGQLTSDSTIGLRLRMAIDGPSPFKRASSERQKRESARMNIETVRRNLLRKLSEWKENERALKSRASALERRIREINKTQASYEEQFSMGLRGINDLLYAEREIFESKRQKTNTQSEYQRIAYRAAAQVGLISHLLEGQLEDVLK